MTNNKAKNDETALSLKNDFLFKVVFGSDTEESKTVLMALLNLILRRDDDPIVDIHYKNPFQYRRYPNDKETVLDIKVTTSSGDLIDIEMQLVWQADLKERLIDYHGGLIRESLSKGDPYGRMKTTITIGIVDAVFLEDEEDFLNEYYFMNSKSHALLTDRSYICCIELPKVNREKKPIGELTPLEICLEYLKYADENGSGYVDALIQRGGKELKMAQEMLKKATEDEILREEAIARERFQKDMISFRYHMDQKAKDAEQKAKDAERKAKEAEQTIKEAEQKAKDAEQKAKDAEQTIKDAEQTIKEAEQKAKEAEQKAKDAEQTIKEAEQKAKDAYNSGITEEKTLIASKLKSRGLPDDEIAAITGLTVKEIGRL